MKAGALAKRSRIAHDVHDTFAQCLTGIYAQIGCPQSHRRRDLRAAKRPDQDIVHDLTPLVIYASLWSASNSMLELSKEVERLPEAN